MSKSTQKAKIIERIQETEDTVTLRLAPLNPFEWKPGQFIMVQQMLAGSSIRRAYSISSSPTITDYLEITVRQTKDPTMSKYLNEVTEGHYLNVRGPYGGFVFDETEIEKAVFLAAGSGITPFRAFLQYKRDKNLQHPTKLLYTCGRGDNVIFREEMEKLNSELPNCEYELSLTRENESSFAQYRKGRIDIEYLDEQIEGYEDASFFVCGSPGFVGVMMMNLIQLGVTGEKLKREQW